MSREHFAEVVRRLRTDKNFSETLSSDAANSVLGEYSLTSAELGVLKDTDPDALVMLADALEDRVASAMNVSTTANACRAV